MSEARESYNARKRQNYRRNRDKAIAASRAWQARNAGHLAAYARRRKLQSFGLTPEQYEAMLASQGGRCVLCPRTPETEGRRLAVDHCHETGKVRGLLCCACNTGIGNLREDPDLMLAAIEYLKRHQRG
jgi:hypothetical protein